MSGRARFPMVAAIALAGPIFGTAASPQEPEPPADLLTLARGAVLVSASVDPVGALALVDGDAASNWNSSTKRKKPPYTFVFELIAPAELTEVGIDGAGPRPGGVSGGSAGPVVVEGSAEGPAGGWRELARFSAAPDGASLVPVDPGAALRWLRFSVGGAQTPEAVWVYFDEVIAHGRLTPPDDPDRFDGVFRTARADFIELHQDGTLIEGCYVDNGGNGNGSIWGAVEEGVALLNWRSDRNITGTALLTIDSAGALTGVRYRQKSRSPWGGPVAAAGTRTPCSPQPAAATAPEPVRDPILAALETAGEVRIYGILFGYDSDVPKPSALPALERLYAALAGAPAMSVDIEGHTDADGDDGYNLDLSRRRAASVVSWLVARGIDPARLAPVGKGEAVPVASNATADGKALNRRVEVRRR